MKCGHQHVLCQSPGDPAPDSRSFLRECCSAMRRRSGDADGLRRRAQHGEAGRRTTSTGKEKDVARASQGRDARLRAGHARKCPRAIGTSASRSSSAAAWRPAPICSGHGVGRGDIFHHRARQRPHHEPHQGEETVAGKELQRDLKRAAFTSAVLHGQVSPRKPARLTRTSTKSSQRLSWRASASRSRD